MQIEHGSFTPLVMLATDGMSRECRKFYVRLLEMISEKRDCNYSTTATWIRRKITFSQMKSMRLCTRGSGNLNIRFEFYMFRVSIVISEQHLVVQDCCSNKVVVPIIICCHFTSKP